MRRRSINIDKVIKDFLIVCKLSHIKLKQNDILVEELSAGPNQKSSDLGDGYMAVYIFIHDKTNTCLKVGKVWTNSKARYISHHYQPSSSGSNLAKSLLKRHPKCFGLIPTKKVGQWIRHNTVRINLRLKTSKKVQTLNLLETFMQCRLDPLYEGRKSQKLTKENK